MGIKGLAVALVAVLALALGTVILIGSFIEDEDPCRPVGGSSLGGGGVPDGELSKPLKTADYVVSSAYKSPERPGHLGIDLAAPTGTAMYAMASGVVSRAGPAAGFGNWIVIDHEIDGKTFSTVYGHMWDDGVGVKAGDTVEAGQHIGEVGSAGGSTGPHLHFEVWEGGRFAGGEVDPTPWIDRAVEPGSGSPAPDRDKGDDKDGDKPKPSNKKPGAGVLVVGDSISQGSRAQLEKAVDGVKVNARVSRPFAEGAQIIRRDLDSLPATLVIALGTNGGVSAADFKALVDEVKKASPGTKVVAVNTYADREWTSGTNAAIAAGGVTVADWHAAVQADKSLVSADGVHPTEAGRAKFAELVAEAIGGGGQDREKPADTRDLADLPTDKIASEANMQVDAIRGARIVAARFPAVQTIGGWRPNGGAAADHPEGRAIDAMIPDFQSGEGVELGNRIKNYFLSHAEELNVEYVIWRQELTPVGGTPYIMEDRHTLTDNHFDHVHVTFHGGGMPKPGQKYGPAPLGGDDDSSAAGTAAQGECGPQVGHGDRELAEGEIPEELRKWIKLAGQECADIDAPLVAGLMYHESAGFQAHAVSPMGAQGYGQFMPDTWAGMGAKVDENGKIAGPPGSGSPNDPADATMAVGRYLCHLADYQRPKIASGELKGDPRTLMLAAYNAGPGHVDQFSGVPPWEEPQKYVVIVPQEAERFAHAAD